MKPRLPINLPKLDIVSGDELDRLHLASMNLLSNPGIRSESDLIFRTCKEAGLPVNPETRTIRVLPEHVDAALKLAPKSFLLHGREAKHDLVIQNGQVYFGMGGASEPYIWDYDLGGPRNPTKQDMITNTRLGERLDNVDFIEAICSAGDVPKALTFIHEYDAIFRNSTKPVIYSAPGRLHASVFIRMAAAICGGESTLKEKPIICGLVTPTAPLRTTRMDESLFEFARLNTPVLIRPSPMMGATGPASIAGTVAQANAEALFILVISQLINPGQPVIYGPAAPAMDMSTMICTYGSPDETLARALIGQLGRYYNLPSYNTAATEAKLPDAAAASEVILGMLMNALSGTTLTQTMGTLASGFYGSPEMLIICDEMARMVKFILRGVTITDETLALEAVREATQTGSFITGEHTAKLFRRELYFPKLFKRRSIDQWERNGKKSILQEAHEQVESILALATPAPLPAGADAELERIMREASKDILDSQGA